MNKFPGFLIPVLFAGLLATWPPVQVLAQEASWGYRWLDMDGNASRASEYQLLEDGPELGLSIHNDYSSPFDLRLDTQVRDEHDYLGELDLSYHQLLRLNVQAEGLVHNLDHFPYSPGLEARPPAEFNNDLRADFRDHDPGQDYKLDVDIYQAHLRGKLPTWPAHVNLNYWRLERQGKQQLRFVDENCAGACHLQSTTREVDRVTEEVKIGLDTHLGWFDIALEQVFREFQEKADPPRDSFDTHGSDGKPETRPAGDYLHDVVPDSRFVETKVQANTAIDGGLVGMASLSVGERENRSDLDTVEAEMRFCKASGDVSYTPGEHWTVNFRYRLLDLDTEKADQISSEGLNPERQPVSIRATPRVQRGFYATSVSYRPVRALTLKADYNREDIERDTTGPASEHETNYRLDNPEPADIDPYWELPEKESIDRFRLGFFSRLLPRSALKINGWGEYRSSNDPAYGTSFERGGEGFLSLSYNPRLNWGVTANLRAIKEQNEDYKLTQFAAGDPVDVDLDRTREQENLTAGFWVSPVEKVNFGFNYGYLRTEIVQDLLFGSPANPADPAGPTDYAIHDENDEYSQHVQTLSASISWQMFDPLGLQLEGYHIRSMAEFSPDFFRESVFYSLGTASASSADLADISEVDIRQNGMRVRFDWQMAKEWKSGLEYTYDDYDSKNSDVFDGIAQTYMASLSRIW